MSTSVPYFLLVILFLIYFIRKIKKNEKITDVYDAYPRLVTPAERSFLGVLDKLVNDNYRVFAKVRLSDILKVRRGLSNSKRQTAMNKINGKHIDFVICRESDLAIVCAIELDDKSHTMPDRIRRDKFVDSIFSSAGVALIRYPAKAKYLLSEIEKPLIKAMGINNDSAEIVSPIQVEKTGISESNQICPSCGGKMEKRKAKKGKYAGQYFWGCSNYPICKNIIKM